MKNDIPAEARRGTMLIPCKCACCTERDDLEAKADRYRLLADTQQNVCGRQSRRVLALQAALLGVEAEATR